jgi:hypothetical protein
MLGSPLQEVFLLNSVLTLFFAFSPSHLLQRHDHIHYSSQLPIKVSRKPNGEAEYKLLSKPLTATLPI